MKNNLLSLKNLIWFCAIGLATFSGYYSVFGIAKLFSGGSWSIVGMAAMLEFSKLVVITFLHDHFSSLKTSFKLYLTSAASVLMIITSIGVYGYLTNSYQETAKHIYQTQNRLELLTKKQQLFSDQKNKLDTLLKQKTQRITSYDNLRLSQENVLNNQLNQKGSTRGLQKNIQSVDKATETLNIEISQLSAKSLALTDSVTIIEQEKLTLSNSTFTSELGPLLYLSRITGLSMDLVVNWFILILVIVFDPLAVSLVIAANHLKNKEKYYIHRVRIFLLLLLKLMRTLWLSIKEEFSMMKMLQKLQIILLALLGVDMTNNYKKNIGLPEIVGDNIWAKWECLE
jgi:hypothetical protein